MPESPGPGKRRPQPTAKIESPGSCRLSYAELHCRTNFSFLEGASHADELVNRAIELRTGVKTAVGVVESISQLSPRPVLLIATGSNDNEVNLSRHFYQEALQPKEIWVIPNATHGDGYFVQPI